MSRARGKRKSEMAFAWLKRQTLQLCLLATILLSTLPVQAQVIHTVAGGGPPDDIAATSASIAPNSPAVDASGNVYFSSDDSVFKLDTTGHLTRVAGEGTSGEIVLGGNACSTLTGDGGPATSAALNGPAAVALDAAGNIYIADSYNYRVRVVNMQANTITVLGVTIPPGYIDAVAGAPPTAGTCTIGYGGDGGPATSALLNLPSGVAVDSSGNLYIADTLNYRIRKVGTSGTITTIAGNGILGHSGDGEAATSAELDTPFGVALDAAGNVYISDSGNNRVRMVSTQSSTITVLGVTLAPGAIATVAGDGVQGHSGDGGAASSAELYLPNGVALDSSGNLYIADTGNARVRKVSTSGIINTIAGTGIAGYSGDSGPATSAEIAAPAGVALDASGDLYIADDVSTATGASDYRIRIVTGGTINTVAGNGYVSYSGDGQAATGAQFSTPNAVAVDPAGNFYIADSFNNVIWAVNTQPSSITLLGVTIAPGDIATVAGNINLHNCSTTTPECFGGDGGPATSAELNLPNGVAVDVAGDLYIADSGNFRIRKVDTSGTISTVVGSDLIGDQNGPATGAALNNPLAVAVDGPGNIYISDNYGNVIRAVNTELAAITVLGVTILPGDIATVAGNGTQGFSGDGGPATSAELSGPIGVAVDAAGNLYFADTGNARLRKVDSSGTITTVAGNGTAGYNGEGPATSSELLGPWGVTVDASGNLYIADYSSVRVVNTQASAITALGFTIPPGNIATVAGVGGFLGFFGDGGLATGAALNGAEGAALDLAGNLYIADEENLRIRRVDVPQIATGPNFSITTASPVVSVPQAGDAGQFQVTITPVNGFSGQIALSLNGNPGLGVSLPASITIPSSGISETFNVVITSATTYGTGYFPIYVIGQTASGLVNSVELELEVATTPTVTVTPSSSSITTTQALPVTIAVSGGSGNPTPTGSVTLTSGSYTSAATTLSGGSATINVPAGSLAVGPDTLTASYTPDSSSSLNYNSATGANSVTVNAASVQVTVGTSPTGLSFTVDGTTYTSAQTFTWTIGSSHPIATTSPQNLSGTQFAFASWSDSGALSHSVTASAGTTSYTASFTATGYLLTTAANPTNGGTVSPATGTYYASGTVVPLSATANSGYSFSSWTGNVASTSSASTTVTMNAPQTVTANFTAITTTVQTWTALTSSLNPSFASQFVTFTATVTSKTAGVPTGSVKFLKGSTILGTVVLVDGKAILTTSFATPGPYLISASYLPSGNYTGSSSMPLSQKVECDPTQTEITSSHSPSWFGQTVIFTATVTSKLGLIPNGETITFFDGATVIGTAELKGGTAILSTSALAVGEHHIHADYPGSGIFAASTSQTLDQKVLASPSCTTLSSSPNPSHQGEVIIFTATVTSETITPTGTVTFSAGDYILGAVKLNSKGIATLETPALWGGDQTITASYDGGDNFTASSASLTQKVWHDWHD